MHHVLFAALCILLTTTGAAAQAVVRAPAGAGIKHSTPVERSGGAARLDSIPRPRPPLPPPLPNWRNDSLSAYQRALEAAEVDPGIVIFYHQIVDSAMIRRVPHNIDPKMLFPREQKRKRQVPQYRKM